MTNALTLTASSLGRASQPSGAGAVLYVDGDNTVTIDAWPQPSQWIPDRVQLFRGDDEVAAPEPGDDWRWVLTGARRFGVFRAVARAGEMLVESPPMVVQPTPVTVLAAAAEDVPGPYVRPSRSEVASATVVPATGVSGRAATPSPAVSEDRAQAVASGAPPASAPRAGGAQASTPKPALGHGRAPRQGWTSDQSQPAHEHTSGASRSSGDAPGTAASGPRDSPSSPSPAGTEPHTTTARIPAHASAADIAATVEIPRSEYDSRFAAWVGAAFITLAGLTLWFATTRLLGDPDLFSAATPPGMPDGPGSPAPFVRPGNVADRIGLGTSTIVMALGIVVILAGAALAALEVRARMLRRDRGGAVDDRHGAASASAPGGPAALHGTPPLHGLAARGTAAALRQVAVIIDRISQPRTVVAVLVTGGSLVLVGFFGQLHWAVRL